MARQQTLKGERRSLAPAILEEKVRAWVADQRIDERTLSGVVWGDGIGRVYLTCARELEGMARTDPWMKTGLLADLADLGRCHGYTCGPRRSGGFVFVAVEDAAKV